MAEITTRFNGNVRKFLSPGPEEVLVEEEKALQKMLLDSPELNAAFEKALVAGKAVHFFDGKLWVKSANYNSLMKRNFTPLLEGEAKETASKVKDMFQLEARPRSSSDPGRFELDTISPPTVRLNGHRRADSQPLVSLSGTRKTDEPVATLFGKKEQAEGESVFEYGRRLARMRQAEKLKQG